MDPRLLVELETLLANINLKTGITNSFDYNRCIEMFEKLLQQGVPFFPEDFEDWLDTSGELLPEDAKAVRKMAEKFAAGKKVRRR